MAITCLHPGELDTGDRSYAENMLRKLPKTSPTTKRTAVQRAVNLSTEEDTRYLQSRLIVHHGITKRKAGLSTSAFREVGQKLSSHLLLWNLGIRTLRLLIDGRAPKSLAESIAFLGPARAMVDTFEARRHRDFLPDFIRDLPRWQVIFDESDAASYREAVWLMWNIDMDPDDVFQTPQGHPFPAEHVSSGNPGGFPNLAPILANSIDECFGTLPSGSLLGSQRVRMQQEESVGFQGHPEETTNPPPPTNLTTEPQPQWDPPPIGPRRICQDQPPISEHDGERDGRIVACLAMAVCFRSRRLVRRNLAEAPAHR
ncbi:uncharacterized protein LY79DRAFT_700956 [Colletotrichum navitas]|uniref:Uncharacterized protein n=1 Tax=Colletotrichum navitas TaxID=681940 RepID=A0AAD8Q8U1_9PEZI|nr:uncharacterized protein LY79DRAFT_700956 [Colletotrichum navitas]KAK1597133.1 hypothetical protein LY79DRAFT_700956 [Colletotrichum navitas]